jgi:spore protease
MRVRVRSDEASRRLKKPKGLYITVDLPDLREINEDELERARCVLGVEMRSLAERMCKRRIDAEFSVLVAGLGNAEIAPDAVGPETLRRLSVTRHLQGSEQALFQTVGLCRISAVTTGVLGRTGVETAELVRGAVSVVKPDLVVAVDALVARSAARLSRTVQLSDSGISPGTGVGNARRALTKETLGVPVMAVGVPTALESSTMVCDALRQAGLFSISQEVRETLRSGKELLVSPKDIDVLVPMAAVLLSGGIERAFAVHRL